MKGRIHSFESFGTVDGPGIRFVIFMQGCPLRCLYCHNPDTWDVNSGTEMSPSEIIELYNKNKAFYTNGGITVTGGEPLLQIDFLIELFTLAKADNIHTCIDTSGITFNKNNTQYLEKIDALLSLTDLILLDIKHIDNEAHIKLTGSPNSNVLSFLEYLSQKNIPVWIRHVVVPGYTDNKDDLYNLGFFIGNFRNIKALDVLPYHTMGVNKYKELDIPYLLSDVKPFPKSDIPRVRNIILNGIKDTRR